MKLYESDIKMLECIKENAFVHGAGTLIQGVNKESFDFVLTRVIDDLKNTEAYNGDRKTN